MFRGENSPEFGAAKGKKTILEAEAAPTRRAERVKGSVRPFN